MKRVVLLSAVFLLTGIISCLNAQITILSGFQGATYFEMAKDIEKIAPPLVTTTEVENRVSVMNEEGFTVDSTYITMSHDSLPFLKVLSSDGSYYNFLKLERTDVDIAFLQYDVLLYEEMRDLTRKFKRTENIRILLSMGSEQVHLITRKNSKITKLSDLKRKNHVGIGSSMQGTNITAKYIKEKVGGKWRDVEIPYDRAFRALLVGDIDAFFFVGAAPVASLNRLSPNLRDQITLVSIEHKDLDDVYEKTTIGSSQYAWLDKDIPTYNIKTVLVCSVADETPEKADNLDKFLQMIKNNLSYLQDPKNAHPQWQNVSFGTDGIEWEFHPLARKYM